MLRGRNFLFLFIAMAAPAMAQPQSLGDVLAGAAGEDGVVNDRLGRQPVLASSPNALASPIMAMWPDSGSEAPKTQPSW